MIVVLHEGEVEPLVEARGDELHRWIKDGQIFTLIPADLFSENRWVLTSVCSVI